MQHEIGRNIDRNFILQQGLQLPDASAHPALISALMFQPRIVALWFLTGWSLQSGYAILALAAALWWGALVPARNLFDFVYDRLPAGRYPRAGVGTAPAPRRFAQGIAGTLAAVVGISVLGGATRAAVAVAMVFCLAVALLVVGRFCLGSFVCHLMRGRFAFAFRTLPWGSASGAAVRCLVSGSRR